MPVVSFMLLIAAHSKSIFCHHTENIVNLYSVAIALLAHEIFNIFAARFRSYSFLGVFALQPYFQIDS